VNGAFVFLGIASLIAGAWVYVFRLDLSDRWNDWQLDREFRKRHRKGAP
jgi:hypothetical protein